MRMVGGLDLHRRQITYDVLDVDSGEIWRGRLWQPDRSRFRHWLEREVRPRAEGSSVALAVEGCTGWRYVVEEISAAGFAPFLAEPADTQAARGSILPAATVRVAHQNIRVSSGQLLPPACPPALVLGGLRTLTRPLSHPGVTQSRLLSPAG